MDLMRHRRFPGRNLLLALVAMGLGVRLSAARAGGGDAVPAPRFSPLAMLLERTLTPTQRAEQAFLEHLGWRFLTDPSASKITVAGGTPTRYPDLASAQAAGALRVLFPPAATSDDVARFGASLAEVADSVATRGAWQFLVAPAVERATSRLAANEQRGAWTFPQWGPLNAPVFSMNPPEAAWLRRKRICCARGKPSAAIEAFYGQRASTECYVGQTIAAYAVQYELYGAAWFDAVFAPDEIAIGQVDDFHETPLGKSMAAPEGYPWRALFLRPTDVGEDLGVVLGRLGPLAFPGLTGIVMDQNPTGRSRQNLLFVSVSPAAADSLVRNDGFAGFAARTEELLELGKLEKAPFVTGPELTASRARIAAILSDPVFREIRVFIHPYGVVTLGAITDQMRRRDLSAVELVLYDEAREDTFFQRYRQAWKARAGARPTGR
jgi:hypothetical protein